MSKPDPKSLCGGIFAREEVKAIMLKELRATQTAEAVWGLPAISTIAPSLPLRPSSGLTEWYRRLGRGRDA